MTQDKKDLEEVKEFYNKYLKAKLEGIKLVDKGTKNKPKITLVADNLNQEEMRALHIVCSIINEKRKVPSQKEQIYEHIYKQLCNYISLKTLRTKDDPLHNDNNYIDELDDVLRNDAKFLLTVPEEFVPVSSITEALLVPNEIYVKTLGGKEIYIKTTLDSILAYMSEYKIKAFCKNTLQSRVDMEALYYYADLNNPLVVEKLYKHMVLPVLKGNKLEEFIYGKEVGTEFISIFTTVLERTDLLTKTQKNVEINKIIDMYRDRFETILNNSDFNVYEFNHFEFFYKYYLAPLLDQPVIPHDKLEKFVRYHDQIYNCNNNRYENLNILISELKSIPQERKDYILVELGKVYEEIMGMDEKPEWD